jgi:hypothetical protein
MEQAQDGFVNSMSDLFHEGIPLSYISRVAATMHLARWHTYQVLTKRSSVSARCGPLHEAAKVAHVGGAFSGRCGMACRESLISSYARPFMPVSGAPSGGLGNIAS